MLFLCPVPIPDGENLQFQVEKIGKKCIGPIGK